MGMPPGGAARRTRSDPPAGIPVALATSRRDVTPDTLTEPIGHEPSTSRSRQPRYKDSEPHQARPAASDASRSASAVLAAHVEVTQLLWIPDQFCPMWSSLMPLAVRKTALRDMTSQSATWWARSTPCRLV